MPNKLETPPAGKRRKKEAVQSGEEIFQDYMEELDLAPEDFVKDMVDVGSGLSPFAKYAKKHNISNKIKSVEPRPVATKASGHVRATVEALPFNDGSFDMVLSLSAIPTIYSGAEYRGRRQAVITQALQEMLRVLRPEGEIRLGNVLVENDGERYRQNYFTDLDIVLDQLKNDPGLEVTLKRKTGAHFLITIRKKKEVQE